MDSIHLVPILSLLSYVDVSRRSTPREKICMCFLYIK
jgi:hypothetical protein